MTGTTRTRRRHMLGALAAGTAGVAAASVLPSTAVARTSAGPAGRAPTSSRGYQASEHVQRYYKLARF